MRRQPALVEDDVAAATSSSSGTPLQSTVAWRIVTLLELLSAHGEPLGVREAARRTGIDRSAVSRLLSQLEHMGCVEQLGERGVYKIGPRLFSIAAAVNARDSLWLAAEPLLSALVAKHGETCYLTVRQGDSVVFRDKVDCSHTIRYVVELGKPFPLTSGAAGTAILSALPPEEVDAIFAQGFERYTDTSFTDEESYRQQLRVDRELGYSLSEGRWVRNGAGIASPFFNADGSCAGALTLSCPADRLNPILVPEIGRSIREASQALSRRLGFHGEWGPRES